MAVWFTSDTHFGHVAVLQYTSRPWANVQDMETALVKGWNQVVGPDDTVYHLGDFAMHPRDDIPRIKALLNGRIILIEGNHDHKKTLTCFPEVYKKLDIVLDGIQVQMVHNPAKATALEGIVLCGHVHDDWAVMLKGQKVPADTRRDHAEKSEAFLAPVPIHNVGVDVRGYRPVSLAEILK